MPNSTSNPAQALPTLHLAPGLDLPSRLITATIAILARKGSGKSHALDILVEEFQAQHQQTIIFDPVGAHWGLRSNFAGDGPGFPIAVFGGDHGIAPLDPRSGRSMATAVVEHGFSAVFDVSNMEEDEKVQFGTEFFRELLRINRRPIHVGIDEAHTWAPQTPYSRPEKQSLSAVKKLVLQGRGRGIGVTLVSQRTQLLNKDIISQCDVLVNMRMSHPKDIAPVYDWLATEIDAAFATEVKSKLSKLERGQAYVCSNEFAVGKLVKFRQRHTFNSGRTPEIGDVAAEPTAAAEIDIAQLGRDIAASVEKAKVTDVAWLQQELERVRQQVQELSTKGVPDMGLTEDIQTMERELDELRPLRDRVQVAEEQAATLAHGLEALEAGIRSVLDDVSVRLAAMREVPAPASIVRPQVQASQSSTRPISEASARPALVNVSPGLVNAPQQRILNAIATLSAIRGAAVTLEWVACTAGTTPRARGFEENLRQLKSLDLVEGSHGLTAAGAQLARAESTLPTFEAVLARLAASCSAPQIMLLRLLHGHARAAEDLATVANTTARARGFEENVRQLRRRGLIELTGGKYRLVNWLGGL